mgnify:CR=1 FL=1
MGLGLGRGDVVVQPTAAYPSYAVGAAVVGAADLITNRRSLQTSALADDGETITVNRLKTVTLDVDGKPKQIKTTATNISSLNVGADGALILTVDPTQSTPSGFNVSGNATLADGAALGVRFSSLLQEPERFTVVEAGSLNVGALDQSALSDNSPYLYVVSATADTAAGRLYVSHAIDGAVSASLGPRRPRRRARPARRWRQ